MSKTRAERIAEEAQLKKEWEKKSGKTTNLPTRTPRGAATPPSSSSRSGKGPMGSGGGLHPQGTVKSYTWPALEEAKRKADADNGKKPPTNGKKPPTNGKKTTGGSKLPVPVKILKEAARSGAIDDLARAAGRYSGQIREWFRRYTGPGSTKPQSNKLPANLSHLKTQSKSSKGSKLPVPTTKSRAASSKVPPSGKPGQSGPHLGRGQSTKPSKPTKIKTKQPTRWGQGLKAAARTAPAVVAVGELGRKGVGTDSKKGRGTHTPYSVKKGDTLSEIARDKGTTLKALLAANNIKAKDANKLRVGQKLVLPGKVKDRKSVYQDMTKSQMAAMHMPKTKRSESMGGDIDSLHGTTRKKKHDVSKYSDMKKKKPIKKKPKKKEPNTLFGFEIDPPEGGREVKLPFGLGSYKTISDAEREKAFAIDNKRGGQIKGYKKGGKVKKVRKASRPRGVGIAQRGWGKAMK